MKCNGVKVTKVDHYNVEAGDLVRFGLEFHLVVLVSSKYSGMVYVMTGWNGHLCFNANAMKNYWRYPSDQNKL